MLTMDRLDPNKMIGIGEWLICGPGPLERSYCISSKPL